MFRNPYPSNLSGFGTWKVFLSAYAAFTGTCHTDFVLVCQGHPRAVLLDDFVYFLHDTDGLAEGDDDFLVAGEVLQCEHAAGTRVLAASGLVVFLEPFFAHLIADDLETPLDSNSLEVTFWSATSAWLRQLRGYLISGEFFYAVVTVL